MLSSIYLKKRLLLFILLIVLLLQAAVVVFHRREAHFSTEVLFGSNYVSKSQTKIVGRRISTLFKDFSIGKNEKIALNKVEVSQNSEPNFYSTIDNIRVKVKSYKDIEKSNMNIFYIESRCGTRKSSLMFGINSTLNLRPRQCCSVESAATMNPSRTVYILYTCLLDTDFDQHLPTYARNTLGLRNVFLVPLSMEEALEGSPVTGLYRSGKLEESVYPVVHASDILRLVVLWRFGGTYCDMDILFIRSLSELGSNFCGLESHNLIGNAILNFEPTGYGHEILNKILRQVNTGFNGQVWAANGPQLITDTMLQECNATIETVTQCTIFTVYNHTVLYPLQWKNHKDIFNTSVGTDVVKTLTVTGFTVHFWNKFTSEYSVQVGSPQAYGLMADEFCPGVYWNCGNTF